MDEIVLQKVQTQDGSVYYTRNVNFLESKIVFRRIGTNTPFTADYKQVHSICIVIKKVDEVL